MSFRKEEVTWSTESTRHKKGWDRTKPSYASRIIGC